MPKVVNHKAYRRELLSKAQLVFEEKNYADVTMREIAAAIQVSTGTLYHYFPAKEDLFYALFLYTAQTSAREIFDLMCNINSFDKKVNILFDYFENQCSGMRRQFLFSADMLRNQMPCKATSLLQRWAGDLNRRLRSILGLNDDEGMMVFMFLAGTLYGRAVLPPNSEMKPALRSFKKMLISSRKNIKPKAI